MKSGITRKPIDPTKVLESVMDDSAGGVVLFIGTVRNSNRGRRVNAIDYEAYKEMAERRIEELAKEVRRRWPVKALTFIHRVGTLKVGEVSVAVGVSSVHRAEAFQAARFAIDRIKKSLPIWKHETLKGGARVWLEESVIET
ncbi:MAG: molybdenum cofactor biosynthesis protein MoaE [Thaumarchaeota archaeon]|jgi:molybdopterin synthase catalytic subunit|nr:molybdenum cofactor biosynthesis protein MoaE [Nitrososphaerota archaeon]